MCRQIVICVFVVCYLHCLGDVAMAMRQPPQNPSGVTQRADECVHEYPVGKNPRDCCWSIWTCTRLCRRLPRFPGMFFCEVAFILTSLWDHRQMDYMSLWKCNKLTRRKHVVLKILVVLCVLRRSIWKNSGMSERRGWWAFGIWNLLVEATQTIMLKPQSVLWKTSFSVVCGRLTSLHS